MSIKVIDFKSKKFTDDFPIALKENGFVVLVNTCITSDNIDSIYKTWVDFFHKSEVDKLNYLYSKDSMAGYIPRSISETAKGFTKKDLKEVFLFYKNKIGPSEQLYNSELLRNKLLLLSDTLLDC